MDLLTLKQEMIRLGIQLTRVQGVLAYTCPERVLTPALTSAIRKHKAALSDAYDQVSFLRAPGPNRASKKPK